MPTRQLVPLPVVPCEWLDLISKENDPLGTVTSLWLLTETCTVPPAYDAVPRSETSLAGMSTRSLTRAVSEPPAGRTTNELPSNGSLNCTDVIEPSLASAAP